MKPTDPRHPWQRLAAAARRAPVESETAPYGFSTRVAALALAERPAVSLVERFALRALGCACLLALASVVFNYSVVTAGQTEEDVVLFSGDPVAALLDPSST